MSADPKLRVKVERLLAGTFDLHDLNQLLFNLRRRCFGKQIIREIGDFIAHSEERDKGVVTKYAQNYFTYVRFRLPTMFNGQKIEPPYQKDLPDGLRAHLEITSEEEIKTDLRFGKVRAGKYLTSFLNKLVQIDDGRWQQHTPATDNEAKVAQYLARQIGFRPLFSAGELFADFIHVLERNGLVAPDEVKRLAWLSGPLALLVVEYMHGCVVTSGGVVAKLSGAATHEGKVCVYASAHVANMEDGTALDLGFQLFVTDLNAADWCDPVLPVNGPWPNAIELRSDQRLHPI